MPTWLKVLLVVGVLLILLIVGVAVAGVYLVRKYGPELVEASKQTIAEGQEYGRRTDNEGCLNEAIARHSRSEGFGDLIKVNLFLRACLEASRPTPGFCDDVPRQTEFMRSAQWQLDECKRHGLSPEKQCGQLFQQVQQFCYMPHARAPKVYNSNDDVYGDSNDDEAPPPAPTRQTNKR